FDAIGDVKPKFFTALDMASGYHQIKMSRKAQKMSAIVCGLYHLEWLRMPFGLSQSPQFFMSYMQRTLQGIDDRRIFVFLDDIIIVSEDIETHLKLIKKVFARLREKGLRLKPSKCDFLCTEINFLGLVLNKDGLRTDPKKVAAITDYEEPKDLKGVRSFLGMAGYFRKFIPNFSAIARPLTNLTKKDNELIWDDACREAFNRLKHLLTTAPVLAFPDFSKTFYIETDASGNGICVQLLQRGGQDYTKENVCCLLDVQEPLLTRSDFHPIAFISKAFNKHEQHYA
ncbi:MAG: hypothetical protein GY738_03065, partial [Pseudoalteromonas sp.]|nr:hypothetical protein [Pseudoalteromonas sp.]